MLAGLAINQARSQLFFFPLVYLLSQFLLQTMSAMAHAQPGAGEHSVSDPQAKVSSFMVASGFLRYQPLSCGEALTFGLE